MCLYSVPGPVGSVSSIMDTTQTVISWTAPSYTPPDCLIISYQIAYYTLTSGNCSLDEVDIDSFAANALKFLNASNNSASTTITDLNDNTCYIFGVRAGTIIGYGEWTIIANETLELPPQPSPTVSVTIPTTSISTEVSPTPTNDVTQSTSSQSLEYCIIIINLLIDIAAIAGGAAGGVLIALIIILLVIILSICLVRQVKLKFLLYYVL